MKAEKVGEYAFLACVVIAILAGIAVGAGAVGTSGPWVGLILVVLGVIVGLTTVTEKEVTPFLIAVIALLAANISIFTAAFAGLAGLDVLGRIIDAILRHIAFFVAPAAIILAVKAIYALASKK